MITTCSFPGIQSRNLLFKSGSLNDSLDVFMSSAVTIPKANYPTRVFIYAYNYNGLDYIEFQSFPGHELMMPIDTTMTYYTTGKYHEKYLTVYSSPKMKGIFNRRCLRSFALTEEDWLLLEKKPPKLGDTDDIYRRWKAFLLSSSGSVELVWSSY